MCSRDTAHSLQKVLAVPARMQDTDAQEWLSSPDVAFDEVASTWEAVGRLSDLYDEALNDSIKKVP